ncbi:hypothetical protein [Sphingopyxis sp. GC21]|uniref:hypothetical protein n=1 Tax=Sphingopyxis sp. GC21 TaxID=2933562 RepID=UPI0021E4CEBB|nr:hypothetical protein [Sphingopyxis sp. GC21]
MFSSRSTMHAFWIAMAGSTALSSLAAAQDSKAPPAELEVFGVDLTTDKEIAVPPEVMAKARGIFDLHRDKFGSPPHIDTRQNGKINAFYIKRAKANPAAASAGDNLPYKGPFQIPLTAKYDLCGGGAAKGAENWCKSGQFSFRMFADAISAWNAELLISHELIHLRQYEKSPGTKAGGAPFWLVEGQANGIGYGLLEREPGFSRKAIALKTKGLKNANFSFFLGLRRYDVPLDINRDTGLYPIDHPEYFRELLRDEDGNLHSDGYLDYAGYQTGSFWRHVMRGRPAGLLAYKKMLDRPGPSDPTNSHAWLKWTDSGLKAATYSRRGTTVPIWRGGLRQVFSEMVTELADLPDIVVKNRTDKLAAPYFDALLWTRSCKNIDLTQATAASLRVTVHPYAAQCMRVKMPIENATGTNAAAPPAPFSVAASGNGVCDDLELGTRGQLLAQPKSFKAKAGASGTNCALVWNAGFAPLRPEDPNGLRGWQTVLLINAPSDPDRQKTHDVLLNFVRPVAASTLAGTHSVDGAGGKKRKKPLPKLKGTPEIQQADPLLVDPTPDESCDARQAAVLACGDIVALSIVSGDASEIARAGEILSAGIAMQYPQGGLGNYAVKTLGELYQQGQQFEARAGALQARAMGGNLNGATIAIAMKRPEEGVVGRFPARVEVEPLDRQPGENSAALTSLTARQTRPIGNGCVDVLSYQTNATVEISVNQPGLLMGSVSATLYEPNADDEAACREPIVAAGTVQVSFSTPGVFPVGPGGRYQVDPARSEFQQLIVQDMAAMMAMPLEERSDTPADDEIDPAAGNRFAGSRAGSGAGTVAQCQGTMVSDADLDAFIRATAAGAGEGDPQLSAQIAQSMRALEPAILAMAVCRWIAAGRPSTFALGNLE